MLTENQNQLLSSLLARSRAGTVGWQPGPDDSSFVAPFASGHSVEVQFLRYSNDDYVLLLRSRTGDIIDSIRDSDVPQGRALPGNVLREIYGLARYKANAVDDVLGEILKELGPAPEPGPDDDIPF